MTNEFPVFEEDIDDIIYFDYTLGLPADFKRWRRRYYELKETNPRFQKYEKDVLRVLEEEKKELNYILATRKSTHRCIKTCVLKA